MNHTKPRSFRKLKSLAKQRKLQKRFSKMLVDNKNVQFW